MADEIFFTLPRTSAIVGPDCWGDPAESQPVGGTLPQGYTQGDLQALQLELTRTLREGSFPSIADCARVMARQFLCSSPGSLAIGIATATISLPYGTLHGSGVQATTSLGGAGSGDVPASRVTLLLDKLRLLCHIGCEEDQRSEWQVVYARLRLCDVDEALDYHALISKIMSMAEETVAVTLESFVLDVVKFLKGCHGFGSFSFSVEKKNVLAAVDGAGVTANLQR
ncbi:hypothetical protein MMYC01_208285 [Madurella mycetomatis]|uniref:Uncharacterized protein n=1 Tax=Madurella mycetomatis TaxID=100816 RepID=A0A175VSG4_9PEZI|nr:hypothetical protein MMYC01_208285 [Madurella mycetomatis]